MRKIISKIQKFVLSASVALLPMMYGLTVMAANESTPENVKTDTMNTLTGIVFWVVRGIIVVVGGIPALIQIVKGRADEQPREMNAGITTLIITGIVFGVSFAVEALI